MIRVDLLLLILLHARGERQYFADWMSFLDPSTSVSKVSLPGTHFSGATSLFPLSGTQFCTQSMSPLQQMNAGIRFFHLAAKVGGDNQTLNVVRLGYFTPYTFQDIQQTGIQFLQDHPKEGLIWRIVEESTDPRLESFQTVLNKNIDNYTDYYYFFSHEHHVPPTVGDLQGRIMIVQDFSPLNSSYYPIGDLIVEQKTDIPNCTSEAIEEHIRTVSSNIQDSYDTQGEQWHLTVSDGECDECTQVINCTSFLVSQQVNPQLVQVLPNFPRFDGIISSSYPPTELLNGVIQNNTFPFRYEQVATLWFLIALIGHLVLYLLPRSLAAVGRFDGIQKKKRSWNLLLHYSLLLEMIFVITATIVYQNVPFRDFGTKWTSTMDFWFCISFLVARVLCNCIFLMIFCDGFRVVETRIFSLVDAIDRAGRRFFSGEVVPFPTTDSQHHGELDAKSSVNSGDEAVQPTRTLFERFLSVLVMAFYAGHLVPWAQQDNPKSYLIFDLLILFFELVFTILQLLRFFYFYQGQETIAWLSFVAFVFTAVNFSLMIVDAHFRHHSSGSDSQKPVTTDLTENDALVPDSPLRAQLLSQN